MRTFGPVVIYPPHRLDVTLAHLWLGLALCVWAQERAARADLERLTAADSAALAFQCVRSAFDALLTAMAWPSGSEVLVTGITIADMPRVLRAHGLVPVAVDLDATTLAPDEADMERLYTARTRAVLVADLFGGQLALQRVAGFCREHDLLLIQDAAQGWTHPSDQGHPGADVTLFSFGTLKTLSSVGGGLAFVRDPSLRARLAAVQAAWPVLPRVAYMRKLWTAALITVVQNPVVYGAAMALLRALGHDPGAAVRSLTRGFGGLDDDRFLIALRRRPCAAQMALLAWRMRHFDPGRLQARAAAGEGLRALLPSGALPGAAQLRRTYWLVPVVTRNPQGLRAALLAAGFDASGASNVVAVGGSRCEALMAGLVFVPLYPEMPAADRQRLAEVVLAHLTSEA